ncbi:hypothetical protein BIW11_05688 [Tropilaelaps mercedesae]|uniref:Uncharacterized protein n=1 Tax=Tropilaelaps mercedesae TaxID=418985 RepID=A0A1V9Y166_9ACAR|nr:hypothetical protein BIW11_05688 [Tropilaelaps mercedesae]
MAATSQDLSKRTYRFTIYACTEAWRRRPSIKTLIRAVSLLLGFRAVFLTFSDTKGPEKYCVMHMISANLNRYLANVKFMAPTLRPIWDVLEHNIGEFAEASFAYGNCADSEVMKDAAWREYSNSLAKLSFVSVGQYTAIFAWPASIMAGPVEWLASEVVRMGDRIEQRWWQLIIRARKLNIDVTTHSEKIVHNSLKTIESNV